MSPAEPAAEEPLPACLSVDAAADVAPVAVDAAPLLALPYAPSVTAAPSPSSAPLAKPRALSRPALPERSFELGAEKPSEIAETIVRSSLGWSSLKCSERSSAWREKKRQRKREILRRKERKERKKDKKGTVSNEKTLRA